jgi:SAM-dependent methyltransferase
MSDNGPRHVDATRRKWDEHAQNYDAYYERFTGAVEHYVDWELLRRHLPARRGARILDAAGGTGRIALPLARMGYQVALCDISPGMLEVARRKLHAERLLDRVAISECDVRELRYADESFDLVLCWIGTLEAAGELIRVTRRGGTISLYLVNRCRAAMDRFSKDPGLALALMESRSAHVDDDEERYRVVSPEEAGELLAAQGIKAVDTYAVCGWMGLLGISKEQQESREWDEGFLRQAGEMVLRLSQDASVRGMARHVALYGERT